MKDKILEIINNHSHIYNGMFVITGGKGKLAEDLEELFNNSSQLEPPVMQKIASIKEQALKGLLTDGGHHKQWFLEAILGMLTTEKEWLYLQEKEQWQKGIAP